jgi:SAM-dependent methyltransferase
MTIDQEQVAPGDHERSLGVLDLIQRRVGNPWLGDLTVLDLACRTGAFSTVLARAGASVVGVEGRQENLLRVDAQSTARYHLDDVRNVDRERYGEFDVTLCLGILYHLEPHASLNLLRCVREMTRRFAVIDTHIGVGRDIITLEANRYEGHWYAEPPGQWSAIGNDASFWFTEDSLDDLIRDAGWTTVESVPRIEWVGEPVGRTWRVIS